MFNTNSSGPKSFTSVLIVAAIIVISGYVITTKINTVEDRFDHVVNHTTPAILALNEIKTYTFFFTLEINEYVLDADIEHEEEAREAEESLQRAIGVYTQAEEGENEDEVQEIAEGAVSIVAFGESILALKDSGEDQTILLAELEELDELAEEYIDLLDAELLRDTRDLVSSQVAVTDQLAKALKTTIVLTSITILALILIGCFIPCKVSGRKEK